MKFRDPETGKIYDSFESLGIRITSGNKEEFEKMCIGNQESIARMVGYEAIEDDVADTDVGRKQDKPLSEWTLGECKAYCESHRIQHPYGCTSDCMLTKHICADDDGKDFPFTWDLSDHPRWTEEDREDARAILKVFGIMNDMEVERKPNGDLWIDTILLNDEIVPSLKPGETVRLADILGQADKEELC